MMNDKLHILKSIPRDLVLRVDLKRPAIAVCRIVVSLGRKQIPAKVEPCLVDASVGTIGCLPSEFLGAVNVASAESNRSCVDEVSRILWVQIVCLHKHLLRRMEIALRFQQVPALC